MSDRAPPRAARLLLRVLSAGIAEGMLGDLSWCAAAATIPSLRRLSEVAGRAPDRPDAQPKAAL